MPKQIKNDEDGRNYTAILSKTITEECNDPEALTVCWRDFKRLHARGFWPTPGEICQLLRRDKADKREYQPITEALPRLQAPDRHRPEAVTQATRDATMKALAEADNMANSGNAMARTLGQQLCRLGLKIIERNGNPL